METKVKLWPQLVFLLLEVYFCDDGLQRPQCSVELEKICASADSDMELQFKQTLTCNQNVSWRLEKNDNDIYFCRHGYHSFSNDAERSNLNYSKMTGSLKIVKVQQSNTGLYKLCEHNHNCTCVELVMSPDGKSCDEATGGQTGPEFNISSDPINPANNSSITGTIIGSVSAFVLFVLFVVIYHIIKKKCEATSTQQRNTDVRSEAVKKEEKSNQDTIKPLLGSTVQSENTAS